MGAESTPPPSQETDVFLAAAIARRFYLENRSKSEIADEFMISRFKVARILAEAVDQGIVQIEVTVPVRRSVELSLALRERFDLSRVIVIDVCQDVANARASQPDEVIPWLGVAAAQLISDIVDDDDILGLAWGRSVEAIGKNITKLARCQVVQLTGSHPDHWDNYEFVSAVHRAAAVGGGSAFPLHAPLIVPHELTATILGKQPGIAATLAQFPHVSKAIVEIGAWAPTLSTMYDALTEHERERYRELGVCAEICGHLFDRNGLVVPTGLSDRVISVEIEELRKVPEVIGIAGDPRKADAIRAILKSGLLDGIVTDGLVARRLLDSGSSGDTGPSAV
ncbi:transcriptional regulator [Streptomyces sp. NA02950]|uniref:sugar-binding transcriptional regulator n=1 Tax=Streptomyces sp. NA02950 TaxID=2742137 RepID=UPI00159242FA|nr:sugar-binding domain-containing protein [Streptomyces sp. NA02950]QKV96035.1 transcriptional regulator [Streptomyces sp. NA02950]